MYPQYPCFTVLTYAHQVSLPKHFIPTACSYCYLNFLHVFISFFFCLLAFSVKFTQGAIPQELRLAAFRLTHITINKLVLESHRRPILPTLDTLPVSHKAFTGHRFCEVVRVHQVGITCLWGDRSIVYRLPEMVGCSVFVAGPGGQSVVPS